MSFLCYSMESLGSGCKEVELPDRIFVFDWNGIPQKIYTLDQGIINFAVDKVQKKIYGISSSPEFHVVEFSYK